MRNSVSGYGGWHLIGKEDKTGGLSIEDYMTYDEIKLAALLQVSSPVLPINSGNRFNDGMAGNGLPHVKEAVYVGVVGARFEKKGCMEYQDVLLEGMFIVYANVLLQYLILENESTKWQLFIWRNGGS